MFKYADLANGLFRISKLHRWTRMNFTILTVYDSTRYLLVFSSMTPFWEKFWNFSILSAMHLGLRSPHAGASAVGTHTNSRGLTQESNF